jgi:histidine ammonia-lyase
VGASPSDSWELETPQLSQYFVKGGPRSNGKHGFIFSNANWDPYPMANEIEAFSIALANLDIVIGQRQLRFTNTFFTVISPAEAMAGEAGRFGATLGSEFDSAALMQEVLGLINPVPPEGNALIRTVEDLQTQTRLKAVRARALVDDTTDLLAEDLLTGTYWLDLRKAQDAGRSFGSAATSVWSAFRKRVPFKADSSEAEGVPIHDLAAAFIREHAAASFYPDDGREASPLSKAEH